MSSTQSSELPGVGVFGTTAVVRCLVAVLRSHGFRVKALWGETEDEVESLAKEVAVPICTCSVDEILLQKDVDLVCIMCPPYLHHQIAVKALNIGKHVLCDRPVGLYQAHVVKMVSAAQYYPSLIALVNHGLRFLPAVTRLKRAVEEGFVGQAQMCEVQIHCSSLVGDHYTWMCDERMGGGVLNTFGSHVIDLVAYVLAGRPVRRVNGLLKTVAKRTESIAGIRDISSDDFCTFQLELEGGMLVTCTVNSCWPAGSFDQEVLLSGSDGYLRLKNQDLFGKNSRTSGDAEERLCDGGDADNSAVLKASTHLPKPYLHGLYKLVGALRHAFLSSSSWAKTSVSNGTTFEEGLNTQTVLDTIRKSNRQRQWLPVLGTSDY